MPLSDEHRRALDEIERQLEREDPTFVATVSSEQFQRLRHRWVIIPTSLFLLGAVLLIAGLVTTHAQLTAGVIISIIGLFTMSAATVWFFRHHRQL